MDGTQPLQSCVGTKLGEGFADALTAGPLAYNNEFPILLTAPGSLRAETDAALADLGIDHVIIVGGTAAVSQAVHSPATAMRRGSRPASTSSRRFVSQRSQCR